LLSLPQIICQKSLEERISYKSSCHLGFWDTGIDFYRAVWQSFHLRKGASESDFAGVDNDVSIHSLTETRSSVFEQQWICRSLSIVKRTWAKKQGLEA
jgi:hypothetical protein